MEKIKRGIFEVLFFIVVFCGSAFVALNIWRPHFNQLVDRRYEERDLWKNQINRCEPIK